MKRFRILLSLFTSLSFSTAVIMSAPAMGGTIGYYNLSNPSDTDAEAPISLAGHTPLQLSGLTTGELSNVNVLWVLNGSNSSYDTELTANLTAVSDFVAGGGALIFHDRYVTDAATVIPGASGISFFRDFTDDEEIQFGPGATGTLVDGPGGVIDETSLDGGNSSSHGYALASTLPAGAVVVFTRSDATEAVDFYYSLGGGQVYYSTIPLDHYLGGSGGINDQMQAYAANLAAYIFELVGPSASPLQFQHIALADTARNRIATIRRNIEAEGLFVDVGHISAERGSSGQSRAFRNWGESFMLGFSKSIHQGWHAGVAFSYDDQGNRSDYDSSLKGEFDSYNVSAFTRYDIPNPGSYDLWGELIVSASRIDDMELDRGSVSGETDGTQYTVSGRLGLDLAVREQFFLTPSVGIEHINTELDDFSEDGTGGMYFDDVRARSSYLVAGLESTMAAFVHGGWKYSPSITLEYRDLIADDGSDSVDTSLASISSSTQQTPLYEFDSDIGTLGLSLGIQKGAMKVNIAAAYTEGNDDLSGSSINISAEYSL